MATAVVTGNVQVSLNWNWVAGLALTNLTDKSQLSYSQAFASGTSLDEYEIDTQYSNNFSLMASANTTLDLTALTQSVNGSTLTTTFGHILQILIVNTSATTGTSITIGPGASNGFAAPWGGTSPLNNLGPTTPWLTGNAFDGWVVDSTHKTIEIVNLDSGNPATFSFAALGTSV